MAFNPFHSFRRYSKVVFAALAILCMFTFVLSSGMGRGDFFDMLTRWFSSGGGRSNAVSLYGKNYDAQEIDQVHYHRRMANDFMDMTVSAAMEGLQRRMFDAAQKLDQASQEQFFRALQEPALRPFILMRAEAEKKTDLIYALGNLNKAAAFQMAVANRRPGEKFFGSIDKLDDTVDFLIWQHEADKLGVKLTPENISELVRTETHDELDKASAAAIHKRMREVYKGGFTDDALIAALGEEFRARIAQVSFIGDASGAGSTTLSDVPDRPTPGQKWELFKDARTTVRVGMIDVPVKNFLANVTQTPTDEELTKLFEKHKNEELAPDRDSPGFKDPRRIQVQWIGASPDLPFYQKAADAVLAIAPALRLLGNTSTTLALLSPLQLDGEVLMQERLFRMREQPWTSPVDILHDSSFWQSNAIEALVGAAAGSVTLRNPIVSGPLAMEATAAQNEFFDRARIGISMIGFAANPDPFAIFAAPFAMMPRVTLEQIRTVLREKAREELLNGSPMARFSEQRRAQQTQSAMMPIGLIAADLYGFRGELMKLNREKGKEAAEKFVADFVKARGLESGRTSEPRDQFNLGDDPGLSPLKQAYRKAYGQQDLLLRRFGPEFFRDQKEVGAPDGLFIPHQFITDLDDNRQFFWWRTEDLSPRVPKFEAARPRVVEAWKLIQARELAKKEAERLKELVQKAQGDARAIKDIAAQHGNLEFFELGPFAEFMPQAFPNQTGGITRSYATVQPGMPPDDIAKVFNIPHDRIAYPDVEMMKQLLALRRDAKGATAVVSDKPKQNFFAAALLERIEPSPKDFMAVYKASLLPRTNPEHDILLEYLSRDRTEKYRNAVVEQLRSEAKVVINDEARKRGDRRE